MAYDRPINEVFNYTGIPLNAAFTRNIRGPKGKRGKVKRIYGSITTTASWTTTAPQVTVTTTAAPVPNRKGGNTYASSTLLATAALVAAAAPSGFDTEGTVGVAGGPGFLQVDEQGLPFTTAADSDLVIAMSAAVGTPAGVIDLYLEIDWV